MNLVRVEAERFRSFVRKAVLTLPEGGLAYVTGRNEVERDLEGNGTGKTSLFEAIHWCLFGKLSSGVKAGDVANWTAPRGCRVKLIGSAFGSPFVVERTWGPISLTINEREVDQPTLERMLGVSPETFVHAYYFPQKDVTFLDLRQEQQMELLVSVLKLGVWDTASDIASTEAGESERMIERLQGNLEAISTEWVSKSLENARASQKKWMKEREERRSELLARLKVAIGRSTVKEGKQKVSQLEAKLRSVNTKRNDLAAEHRALKAKMSEFRRLAEAGVCHTCGKKYSSHDFHADVPKADVKRMRELSNLIDELAVEGAAITRRIDKANEALDLARRSAQTVAILQEKLDDLNKEVNPYTEQREQLEREQFRNRLRRGVLKARLNLATKQHEVTNFWVRGFKEVRLLIVNDVISQLEAEVNQTIHELGLQGWSIRFDVEREKKGGGISRGFNAMVLSPRNEKAVPWKAWSGGEAQRLRLAGAMGFANLIHAMSGDTSNFELWDEPSSWMARKGIEQMLTALGERARKQNKCIMVADHRALGFGGFSSTINIVKRKGGSEIHEQNSSTPGRPYPRPVQMGAGKLRLAQRKPQLSDGQRRARIFARFE